MDCSWRALTAKQGGGWGIQGPADAVIPGAKVNVKAASGKVASVRVGEIVSTFRDSASGVQVAIAQKGEDRWVPARKETQASPLEKATARKASRKAAQAAQAAAPAEPAEPAVEEAPSCDCKFCGVALTDKNRGSKHYCELCVPLAF